ncbi:hypothetical protein ACFV1U_14540 [Streptomyces microflavus]|uniref:hypothetical protein n=1 Tax=Streptomyces microflavus TaxID=1919 RepID=UPI0036BA9D98
MHYTDDPLMNTTRRNHQLILEPITTTTTTLLGTRTDLYRAGCTAGDWIDPRTYDYNAHAESFDQHMTELQEQLHTPEPGPAEHDSRPDEEA